MRIVTRSARRAAVTLAVGALALSSTACGSKSSTNGTGAAATTTPPAATTGVASTPTGSTPSSAAAPIVLPANIKKAGVIKIATDASYPPIESVPSGGKTIIGLDPDLGAALGKVLGVKVTFVNADFNGIVAGVASGRYDMAMSAMTDSAKREKTVDFVDYYSAGTSFMIKKGGPTINTIADICGLKVAVENGTTQLDDVTNQSKKCGSKKVTLLGFDKQDKANEALLSGRAQVVMADSPVNAYEALKSNGALVITGTVYGTAPYGIAIPKKSTQLRAAVAAALAKLIADGTYTKVLTHWGIQSGALTKVAINGAVG